MSAVSCMLAELEMPSYETLAQDERFATAPLLAFTPTFQRSDEEELHTSFEAAISDRLVALHGRLSRLSDPAVHASLRPIVAREEYLTMPVSAVLPVTNSITLPASAEAVNPKAHWSWHPALCYGGLALLCSLVGFDLMGLLVLHLH
jgi:hypothetical protein